MKNYVNIVAHRGASGTFPENTLSAFREAIRLGVESIEFDVHLSKDEELIVIHDNSVDRTTNGSGRIEHLTLEEIKRLDAGVKFGGQFPDERILTLSETLEIMPDDMRLNIHVKAHPDTRSIVTEKVINEMVRRDILDSAFFTSDADTVKLVKQMNPDVATCNLSWKDGMSYAEYSRSLGSYILQPNRWLTTSELVEEAHASKMEVNIFYADEEEGMLTLMEMGVDGILTNFPERLKNLREKA